MPLFFGAYFLMPGRTAKNLLLLVASLGFYAWGEPVYVALLLVSIVVNWILGLLVRPAEAQAPQDGKDDSRAPGRRGVLVAAVVFNLLLIGFFKYEGFFADTLNGIAGTTLLPNLELPLPVGISFYTLQALSYVVDVYRGDVAAQRNPLYLGMYIACFPQLVAGPIVRYQDIQDRIVQRQETLANAADGLRLFIVGLSKKVLLANTCAILATRMVHMDGAEIGVVGAWAGLAAYTFQIYFDFGGYSDMAIGLGRMMGFEYLRNFNYPYIATSITEFWRRWHISLSSFFRDYLYIPLGGNRCSTARWVFNLLVVWALTGLWHGAAWNYVLWGLYYGVLLIGERLLWGEALAKAPKVVGHLYTIFVFTFGWSFFWITDPGELFSFWRAMFGAFGTTGTSTLWDLTAWEYWPLFVICAVAASPIVPLCKERILAFVENRPAADIFEAGVANTGYHESENLCAFDARPASTSRAAMLRVAQLLYSIVLAILLLMCIAGIVSGSFNPFIYFQF